jgi:hypothetical protein
LEDQWSKSFSDGSVGAYEVARIIPTEGVSQTISVVLESEVNPHWLERSNYTDISTGLSDSPTSEREGEVRQGFDYTYHNGFSVENKVKTLIPYSSSEANITEFPNRIIYSDIKLLGSTEEGFDRFRVGNTYDIDGEYGALTKLIKNNDKMYGIQEHGFCYIPVGEKVLEESTSANISVRSGDIINEPVYISSKYGTKYPRTVASGDDKVFFADTSARVVIMFAGNKFEKISDKGMISEFNTKFNPITGIGSNADRSNVSGHYNPYRRIYVLTNDAYVAEINSRWCWAYSDALGIWMSEWDYNKNDKSTKSWFFFEGTTYVISSSNELVSSNYAPSNMLNPPIGWYEAVFGADDLGNDNNNIKVYATSPNPPIVVEKWYDLTTNSYDFTTTSDSTGPQFLPLVPSGVSKDNNVFATGTSSEFLENAALGTAMDSLTQGELVFHIDTSTQGSFMYIGESGSATKYLRCQITGSNHVSFQMTDGTVNNTIRVAEALSGYKTIRFSSSGTAYKIVIDGVEKSLTVDTGSNNGDWFGDMTITTNIVRMARSTSGGLYFDAKYKAFLAFDAQLSDSDGEVLDQYLVDNYINGTDYKHGLGIHTVETGDAGKILGVTTAEDSYMQFIINPDIDYVKTYDNIIVNATGGSGGRLKNITLDTSRDTSLTDQTTGTMSLDNAPREDIHKIKVVRESGTSNRMRGTHATALLYWDNTTYNEVVPVTSVLTKYRLSNRTD